MDINDLEKLFDVKLDSIKDQLTNVKSQVQDVKNEVQEVNLEVNSRIDKIVSNMKWLIGIVMPAVIVILTAFANWVMKNVT